jgi:hypothetical protein
MCRRCAACVAHTQPHVLPCSFSFRSHSCLFWRFRRTAMKGSMLSASAPTHNCLLVVQLYLQWYTQALQTVRMAYLPISE